MSTRRQDSLSKVRFHVLLSEEKDIDYSCADYDYIFADDEREANPTSYKFLQMAHAWAAAKKTGTSGAGSSSGGVQSRFTAAVSKDDHDTDRRVESDDGGASDPMDEDEASVASSQGDS